MMTTIVMVGIVVPTIITVGLAVLGAIVPIVLLSVLFKKSSWTKIEP